MQSGDYRDKFEIARVENVIDEHGEQTGKLTTAYRGYAKVNNLSSREFWEAYAVKQESTLQFYTRWHPELERLDTKRHVLLWRGRTLDITSIDNVEHKNRYAIIKAKEVERGKVYQRG